MSQQTIDFQKLSMIQEELPLKEEVLEKENMKNLLTLLGAESQPDPHFFQDYNDDQQQSPAKKKYCSTKVKTRNLLTNVSYQRYSLKDGKDVFYTDLFPYLLLNLNPTGLDRKLDSPYERDQIKMIWDVCVLRSFTRFIYIKITIPIFANKI